MLRSEHYRYQPHDKIVRQHFGEQRAAANFDLACVRCGALLKRKSIGGAAYEMAGEIDISTKKRS
jgi:hypothetical protein